MSTLRYFVLEVLYYFRNKIAVPLGDMTDNESANLS